MKQSYVIKLDVEQNDFERYVTHSMFYTPQQLNIVAVLMKNEFKGYLKLMEGIQHKIRVRLLNSDIYKSYIVFDFTTNDVYYQTEVNNVFDFEEPISIMTCMGDDYHTEISRHAYDNTYILNEFEKPTKLLVAMYYNDVLALVEKETERFTNTNKLIANLVKEYQEVVEPKLQKEVDKTDEK